MKILAKYDCKESASPLAEPGARAHPECDSQDDGASQQEVVPLFFPRLDRLYEVFSRGEDTSNNVVIPDQDRVTQQIIGR